MSNYLFALNVSNYNCTFEDGTHPRFGSLTCFDTIESALQVLTGYMDGRDNIVVYDMKGNYIESIELGLVDQVHSHYFESDDSYRSTMHAYRVHRMEQSLLYGDPGDSKPVFSVGSAVLGNIKSVHYGDPVDSKNHLVRINRVASSGYLYRGGYAPTRKVKVIK